jgi:CopG family nickel-responsive transcriptional regulator
VDNVTRIGVSLEPELLDKFDELIALKRYATRSEAIRDLIRETLNRSHIADEDSIAFGSITLVYEHHHSGVKEKLMEIQHGHYAHISSSMHVHMDLERCLEVLVVSGTVRQIKALADELASVKGVLLGIPILMSGSLPGVVPHDHVHPHTH